MSSSSSSTSTGAGPSARGGGAYHSSLGGGGRPSAITRASTTGSMSASSTSSVRSSASSSGRGSAMFRTYSSRSSGLLASSGAKGVGGSVGSSVAVGGSSGSSSENLPPRTLARVARDVRDLIKKPPEGIRLVVDEETGMPGSLSEIMAEIEGPTDTPYSSRFFRLKLVLGTDFPSTPPRGHFLTKIYHPNVDDTTGAICVNTLKKDWTSTTSLSHVLTVIRCLLIVPFPESSLNDEAGKMFMESYDEYARRARLMAGVHGLRSWSSVSDFDESDGGRDEKKKSKRKDDSGKGSNGSSSLPNSAGNGGNNENIKLGKNGNRSNIVRGSSKSTLDKKSKKKSLKRL